MSEIKIPRLRTVDKIKPPFPLNQFPPDFGYILGKEIVYLLATKSTADLAGPEWEQIFAKGIGATWKPSNVGLDDVTLGVYAWGAKTVKNPRPHQANIVRLISGRNSPAYSYEQMELNADPQEIGIDVSGGVRKSDRRASFHLATTRLAIYDHRESSTRLSIDKS